MPLTNGNFFKDMQMIISGGLVPRVDQIVDKSTYLSILPFFFLRFNIPVLVFPIFQRQAKELVDDSQKLETSVDLFNHTRRCIAEGMLAITFGEVGRIFPEKLAPLTQLMHSAT